MEATSFFKTALRILIYNIVFKDHRLIDETKHFGVQKAEGT